MNEQQFQATMHELMGAICTWDEELAISKIKLLHDCGKLRHIIFQDIHEHFPDMENYGHIKKNEYDYIPFYTSDTLKLLELACDWKSKKLISLLLGYIAIYSKKDRDFNKAFSQEDLIFYLDTLYFVSNEDRLEKFKTIPKDYETHMEEITSMLIKSFDPEHKVLEHWCFTPPVVTALQSGFFQAVRKLLEEYKIDPNKNLNKNIYNGSLFTNVLDDTEAYEEEYYDRNKIDRIIALFTEFGADINAMVTAREEKETYEEPLLHHHFFDFEHATALKLLQHGADLRKKDSKGREILDKISIEDIEAFIDKTIENKHRFSFLTKRQFEQYFKENNPDREHSDEDRKRILRKIRKVEFTDDSPNMLLSQLMSANPQLDKPSFRDIEEFIDKTIKDKHRFSFLTKRQFEQYFKENNPGRERSDEDRKRILGKIRKVEFTDDSPNMLLTQVMSANWQANKALLLSIISGAIEFSGTIDCKMNNKQAISKPAKVALIDELSAFVGYFADELIEQNSVINKIHEALKKEDEVSRFSKKVSVLFKTRPLTEGERNQIMIFLENASNINTELFKLYATSKTDLPKKEFSYTENNTAPTLFNVPSIRPREEKQEQERPAKPFKFSGDSTS